VSTTTYNLDISDQPADPTLTPSDLTICLGESVTLFGTNFSIGTNGTYNWGGDTLTVSPQTSTIVVTPSVAGTITYSYNVTIDNCTSETATVNISVEDVPTITGVGTSSDITCLDGTTNVIIDATVTGAISTVWSGPLGFSSTTEDALITGATSANNGAYILTATSANGCVSTTTYDLDISDQPADPT
ncbi:MAG: hypothetical protein ACPGVD_12770, partial [Flavobacteriales bacterium]